MYEVVMRRWNRSFVEIETEWTDDQFYMMLDRAVESNEEEKKQVEEMEKENKRDAQNRRGGGSAGSRVVTLAELF